MSTVEQATQAVLRSTRELVKAATAEAIEAQHGTGDYQQGFAEGHAVARAEVQTIIAQAEPRIVLERIAGHLESTMPRKEVGNWATAERAARNRVIALLHELALDNQFPTQAGTLAAYDTARAQW